MTQVVDILSLPKECASAYFTKSGTALSTQAGNMVHLALSDVNIRQIPGLATEVLEYIGEHLSGDLTPFELRSPMVHEGVLLMGDLVMFLYGNTHFNNVTHIVFLYDSRLIFIPVALRDTYRMHFQGLISQSFRDGIGEITNEFMNSISHSLIPSGEFLELYKKCKLQHEYSSSLAKNVCFTFNIESLTLLSCDFMHSEQQVRANFSEFRGPLNKSILTRKIGLNQVVLLQNIINTTVVGESKYYTSSTQYSHYRGQNFSHLSQDLSATGLSKSEDEASLKSWAEAMERYVSGWTTFDIDIGMRRESLVDSKMVNHIVGADLCDGNTHALCTLGYQLNSSRSIDYSSEFAIPGELVFYPYPRKERQVEYYATSSGVASHSSYEQAINNALFELCERDAIMLTWLLRLSPPKISIETLPSEGQLIIESISREFSGKIELFDISYNSPFFIFLCVGRNLLTGEIILGASCNNNPLKCLEKTLDEIVASLSHTHHATGEYISTNDINSPSDHRYFYEQLSQAHNLDYLFLNQMSISWKSINGRMVETGDVVNHYLSCTNDILRVVDLTTKYSQDCGLYTIRILSEKLIPIWFGSKNKLPLEKKSLGNVFYKQYQLTNTPLEIPLFLHFFD